MTNINFRKATLEDLEVLQQLAYQTFKDAFEKQNTAENMQQYLENAFNLNKVRAELLNKHSFFYLAYLNKTIVGYFKLNIKTAQTEAIEAGLEIERIYVLSTYQNKGIGQLMMNKIKTIAQTLQKRQLWLGVWDQNQGAIQFYQRNGFNIFAKHGFYLGTEQQTDYLMKINLEND